MISLTTILSAVILGIVQGITEFLPVSSSGHLVLMGHFFGFDNPGITFEVAVHFGTLAAVFIVFRSQIIALIQAFFKAVGLMTKPKELTGYYRRSEEFRLIFALFIGTIPAALIGLTFESTIEALFDAPLIAACMIVVTGIILFLTRFSKSGDKTPGPLHALIIGFAQACAIMPGISRSGATISTALFLGIKREKAGEFSFLLSIPVILGATVLKIPELTHAGSWKLPLVGAISAGIVGWASLKVLLAVVRRGSLYWFALYCFAVGVVGLFWLL